MSPAGAEEALLPVRWPGPTGQAGSVPSACTFSTSAAAPAAVHRGGWAVRCPSPALRPGAGCRQWLAALPLVTDPWRLNLSASSPAASSVHGSLAAAAHTGLSAPPLPGQPCVDSLAWTAEEEVPRCRPPRGRASGPENTSRQSPPASRCRSGVPEDVWDGSATPRGRAEGGARPGPGPTPPFPGLGTPSRGGQDTGGNGRSRNRWKEKGRHYRANGRPETQLLSPRRAAGGRALLRGWCLSAHGSHGHRCPFPEDGLSP